MKTQFNLFVESKEQFSDDEQYMKIALAAATKARAKNDATIGAIIAWPKHYLVEHDTTHSECNPLNYAGLNVVNKGLAMMPHRMKTGILYCTLEPNALTVLAAKTAGINEVIFGAYDHKDGFVSSTIRNLDTKAYDIVYKGGVLAQECFDALPAEIKEYANVKPPVGD